MGVEYRALLLPPSSGFRPSPAQLAALVEALTADAWIAGPGELLRERHGETEPMPEAPDAAWFAELPPECVLRWAFERLDEDDEVQYPFDIEPGEEVYFDIELALSDDFVYRTNEGIDPFATTQCRCGTELARYDDDDPLYDSARIARVCPGCGAAVDPSSWKADVRDPFTGQERSVPGGATSRFAVVIDCGKALPSEDDAVPVAPELIATCRRALGVELHEIGEVY